MRNGPSPWLREAGRFSFDLRESLCVCYCLPIGTSRHNEGAKMSNTKPVAVLRKDPTEVYVYEGPRYVVALTEVKGSVWDRFFDIEVYDKDSFFDDGWKYEGCLGNDLVMRIVDSLLAAPATTAKGA